MCKLIEYQYTENFNIKVTKQQKQTLQKIKSTYKINPAHFVREAIKEKIERDYKQLKEKIIKSDCPF